MGDLGAVCPIKCLAKGMVVVCKKEGERKERMEEREGGREGGNGEGREERKVGREGGNKKGRRGGRKTDCPSIIRSRL